MKKIVALLLCGCMLASAPAVTVNADELGMEQIAVETVGSDMETVQFEAEAVETDDTEQIAAETIEAGNDTAEECVTLEAAADTTTVKTLTTGKTTLTELGDYQFTPKESAFYTVKRLYLCTTDGKNTYYGGTYPFTYKNANNVTSCYLEAGKTYTLTLPGSNFVSGYVSIDKASDAISFGDNEVDMDSYKHLIYVFSIDEADTFNFVSDTDGNLDCYLYSTEGFVNRTSGTNDISDDDKDFNASYDLPAGSYLFMIESKTELTGTYNVSHTNHIKETLARVEPTCYSEGRQAGTRCKVCGKVYSGLGVLPIVNCSYTNFVYNNNATLSFDGTETAYCDYGCGTRYTRTKKGTKTGLDAPVMKSVSNTTTGVTLTWNAVSGAAKYRVYYKTATATGETTSWKAVGNTTKTSYNFTGLTSGTVYGFTVRCITADEKSFTSDYDDVAGIVYLSSVKPTVSNTTTGVSVKWSKVTGASGYYVYRKSGSGSYARISTITSGSTVSYTDKTAASGTTYTYAVRAYNRDYYEEYGEEFKSWFTGVSVYCLSSVTPTLSNTTKGMNVKWSKITGANGYCVYRKSGSGSYTRIATVTGGDTLSYLDEDVSNGTIYTYAVRAYRGSTKGSFTARSYARLSTVGISSASAGGSGKITVKWAANSQATGYQIQYSTNSSFTGASTVTVKSASTVSQTISSLTKGTTYYVRVRTYRNINSVNYFSAWSSAKSVKVS